MKFGKYLEARQLELAEYNSHFIDYKALKKLIKQLAIPTLKTSSELDLHLTLDDIDEKIIHQRLQENKAAFFFKLERELEKVNGYYLARESDLRIKFNILHSKYNDYKSNGKLTSNQATSFKNLYAAFKKFQKDLRNLEQYVELNKTGFSKALKKWDKRSQSHDKDFYLATVVSIQPIFTKDGPLKLNDETLHILLELNDIDNNNRTAGLESNDFVSEDNNDGKRELNSYQLATSKTSENQLQHIFSAPSSSSLDMEMEIENWYKEILNITTVKDIQRKHALLRNFREAKIFTYLLQNASESFHKNVFSLLKECLTTLFLLLVASPLDDNSLHIFYKSNQDHIDLSYCDEDDQVFSRKNVFHEAASCPNQSRLFVLDEALTTSKLSKETVQKLLNAQDIHARVPLHYASELGKLEFVHSLLITNLLKDIDPIDSDSKTPLVLAITNNHIDVVRDLLTIGGANASPVEKPVLDYSKNIISSAKVQFDPLNVACKFNNHDAAKLLLEIRSKQNADHNKQSSQHLCQPLFKKNSTGLCTLHIVAKIGGDAQLIQLLIQYGADPNEIDGFNKWTPIFYAVRSGHSEVIGELLRNGARLDIEDDNGHSPLFYALWESHVGVLNALLQTPTNLAPKYLNEADAQIKRLQASTIALTPNDNKSDLDIPDSIPDFALPPPIIPLRKYGHNFLEKKIFIKLKLKPGLESIKLTKDNGIIMSSSPGRITLSSNLPEILPRNIILPVRVDENNDFGKNISETNDEEDDEEISEDHDDGELIFQVDSIKDFSMDFEIFPAFGTRIIAKTTAMSYHCIKPAMNSITTINLPLFDTRLNNIGCLTFDYQIIFPYPGNPLKIIKYEPYWKSTGGDMMTSSSKEGNFVTSSSLNGSFVSILVCTLNDGTIVAAPKPFVEFRGTKILLNDLTKEQLGKLVDYDLGKIDGSFNEVTLKQYLSSRIFPLRSLLEVIPGSVQLVVRVCFPTDEEIDTIPVKISPFININEFIDKLLLIIFEHERFLRHNGSESMRQIVFSSCNWEACSILNWKQPNFPVLLQMKNLFRDSNTGKFISDTPNCLKELAVNPQKMSYLDTAPLNIHTMIQFAINNNLLGVTIPHETLKICPSLTKNIKQSGLLLIASIDENEQLPNNENNSGIYCGSELLFENNIDM
ncbi:Pho81p [Saccharomyces eubayanus]|uniref:Pho81p n=1 Tax=Saccharomyces eubayanus TaxID=1080349 RepID=UPI0006C280DC|nr:PHO81-like protein [Saccharomyces eubayanus]KOG99715.1 PHO81-like protein [Saccharomyces eubayanus]